MLAVLDDATLRVGACGKGMVCREQESNLHADDVRLRCAIFDGQCAAHVLVAGVEFLLLVEATLRISNDFPHDLCAARGDDQAMSTESHSAFWAIPQVVSLAILLRRNTVDAFIEEA